MTEITDSISDTNDGRPPTRRPSRLASLNESARGFRRRHPKLVINIITNTLSGILVAVVVAVVVGFIGLFVWSEMDQHAKDSADQAKQQAYAEAAATNRYQTGQVGVSCTRDSYATTTPIEVFTNSLGQIGEVAFSGGKLIPDPRQGLPATATIFMTYEGQDDLPFEQVIVYLPDVWEGSPDMIVPGETSPVVPVGTTKVTIHLKVTVSSQPWCSSETPITLVPAAG